MSDIGMNDIEMKILDLIINKIKTDSTYKKNILVTWINTIIERKVINKLLNNELPGVGLYIKTASYKKIIEKYGIPFGTILDGTREELLRSNGYMFNYMLKSTNVNELIIMINNTIKHGVFDCLFRAKREMYGAKKTTDGKLAEIIFDYAETEYSQSDKLGKYDGYYIRFINFSGFNNDIRCIEQDLLNDYLPKNLTNTEYSNYKNDSDVDKNDDNIIKGRAYYKKAFKTCHAIEINKETLVGDIVACVWAVKSSKYDSNYELLCDVEFYIFQLFFYTKLFLYINLLQVTHY